MDEEQVLKELIDELDKLIEPKKIWLEWGTDIAISLIIKEGGKALKDFNIAIYNEFLQLAQEFVVANKAGMIDEAADLVGEIFKLIFLNKK